MINVDDQTKSMWLTLGEQIANADPARFREVTAALQDLAEAQRGAARFRQVLLRVARSFVTGN